MALSKLDSTALGTLSGNLSFASGQGIDFSATGDGLETMSNELFDDYEEGTWTATVATGTVTSTGGKYTKIGNIVHCEVVLSTFSNTTSSNNVRINGLPYSGAAGNVPATGSSVFSTNVSNITALMGYLETTSNFMLYQSTTAGAYSALQHLDFNSNTTIYVGFSYRSV